MKKNKKNVLKWLLGLPSKYKVTVIFLSLISFLSAYLGVTFAVACKKVIDAAQKGDAKAFKTSCVLAAAVIVGLLLSGAAQRFVKGYADATLQKIFRKRFAKNALDKKYEKLSAYHSGELVNRMTSDTTVVAEGITSVVPEILYYLTQLVYAAILLFVYMREFMLWVVPIGIVIFSAALFLRKVMKKYHRSVRSADGGVKSFYQEIFSSFSVVKAFGAHERIEDQGDKLLTKHSRQRIKQSVISSLSNACFAALLWGSYVAAFIYCGVGILAGRITYGTLVAVQQLINKVQTPFSGISAIVSAMAAVEASAERIMEIEELESDPCDPSLVEHNRANGFGTLTLDKVAFSYGDEKQILEDFSMKVEKGDFACIVGPSGTGKSTVLKLVLRLNTGYGGKIIVTDAKGNQLESDKLSGIFAYVPQGNFLFSGTVRENIALFSNVNDENSVIKAAKIACAHEFIEKLPNGYDTYLSERGVGLSEGQVQRLAVARAVLTGCPVLLLDEATSALDEKVEAQMLANLKELGGMTVVAVTHRKAALEICNKVIEIN